MSRQRGTFTELQLCITVYAVSVGAAFREFHQASEQLLLCLLRTHTHTDACTHVTDWQQTHTLSSHVILAWHQREERETVRRGKWITSDTDGFLCYRGDVFNLNSFSTLCFIAFFVLFFSSFQLFPQDEEWDAKSQTEDVRLRTP